MKLRLGRREGDVLLIIGIILLVYVVLVIGLILVVVSLVTRTRRRS